jgi:hypothetical protein
VYTETERGLHWFTGDSKELAAAGKTGMELVFRNMRNVYREINT